LSKILFGRQFELESLKCKFSKKKVFGDGENSDAGGESVKGKGWKDKGDNKKKSFIELFTKCKLTPDLWKFTPGLQASLANDNGSSTKLDLSYDLVRDFKRNFFWVNFQERRTPGGWTSSRSNPSTLCSALAQNLKSSARIAMGKI
jgi:hypothetical protein